MSAMPADPDPLPGFPANDPWANRVNDAGDFVSRDSGILDPRKGPLFGKRVAVADTARLHLDTHRSSTCLWNVPFNEF
jgi:hypothetical protein